MSSRANKMVKQWGVIGLCALLVVGAVVAVTLFDQPEIKAADFEECKKAGGAILESYPEQCMINGVTHVNKAQSPVANDSEYIGLAEEAALAKASDAKIPARVVVRDDEEIAITMDFVFGRYNFHVHDGLVSKIEIEGQGMDSPASTEPSN